MGRTWNSDRARDHIDRKLADVDTVEIIDYTRDMSLENIPANKAYWMHGVHLYADILNLADMLGDEKEIDHQQTLRFLNQHYRAVDRILTRCDARQVDFHNQRLHGVVAKPYTNATNPNAEADRIRRGVAIAQLIIDVLAETGDDDKGIPNAKVRVGIDSGQALAVNNGRHGGREPLFLGDPANRAAKLSGAGQGCGIFMTNTAREKLGWEKATNEEAKALTKAEIADCQDKAELPVSKDDIIQEWRDDLAKKPIEAFKFSRHTPPLHRLAVADLSPGNSRRQEAISLYADIAGFTAYVRNNIETNPQDVVRVFHVIRAELDRVLGTEFQGRRIRHIGDCLHGLICEGTSKTTDQEETVSTSVLCAGGLRSSFNLACQRLAEAGIDTDALGLAIGFEFGPVTITRLGLKGRMVRCSVSHCVRIGEREQDRCNGTETALGKTAYDNGTDAVRQLFGASRQVANLTYNEAVTKLTQKGDATARGAAEAAAAASAMPAAATAAAAKPIRPHASRS